MTEEAQRIAIAETCGWKNIRIEEIVTPEDGYMAPVGAYDYDGQPNSYANDGTEIPSYLTDLNAMHEAEKVLSMGQRRQCVLALRYVIAGSWPAKLDLEWQMKQAEHGGPEAGMYDHGFCAVMLAATAAQRAEAFLRALGKWEDGK